MVILVILMLLPNSERHFERSLMMRQHYKVEREIP
jgi:hypothetical protein